MMNVMYWGEWKDLLENSNRLEILTNDSVTAQEITLTDFAVEWPENEPFSDSCVFGSGANIGLVSETKMKYLNTLYTINAQQLMVKHYLNGVLNWCGWLDTEQYQDNFSNAENYNISFSANDGVSLMERLAFSDVPQIGVESELNVIKTCLEKLNISFDHIYIDLSTNITGIVLQPEETLLHKGYVTLANYFDETGESLNCREVVNAILLPLTAKLCIWQNSIYILDINKLTPGLIGAKRYSFSSLEYIDQVSLPNQYTIDSMLNRREAIEMKSGVNQVNLKFQKYCYNNPTSFAFDGDSIDGLVGVSEHTATDGDVYKETSYLNCSFIDVIDSTNVRFIYKEKKTDDAENEWFMRFKPLMLQPHQPYASEAIAVPSFKFCPRMYLTSSSLFIRITFKMMLEDLSRYGDQHVTDLPTGLYQKRIFTKAMIGDRLWLANTWPLRSSVLSTSEFVAGFVFNSSGSNPEGNFDGSVSIDRYNASINQWQDFSFPFPLNSDLHGGILGDLFKTESVSGGLLEMTFAKYSAAPDKYTCCIKDFKIEVCRKTDKNKLEPSSNSDEEVVGYLNSNFKNSLSVETLHGTDSGGISRGGLLLRLMGVYSDSIYATNERYTGINTFNRNGRVGTLEELMLNTYLSNMQQSRYLFNVDLDGYKPPLMTYFFDLLQRNGQNVRLLGTSIKHDYNRASSALKLLEFVGDELTKA